LTESVKSRREFGREQTANGEQKKKREFYWHLHHYFYL
jgi:hypothetical protein